MNPAFAAHTAWQEVRHGSLSDTPRGAAAGRAGDTYREKRGAAHIVRGLLTREPLRIEGVPHLTDVDTLWAILQDCGAQICREGDALTLFTPEPVSPVEEDLLSRMRASVLVMGPLLARTATPGRAAPAGLRHWAASH